jgi:hypothetical protein
MQWQSQSSCTCLPQLPHASQINIYQTLCDKWFQSFKTMTKIFQHMNHAIKIQGPLIQVHQTQVHIII